MANISTAHGSFTLTGSWTPAQIKLLNTIAEKVWAKWHYDITLDAFEVDGTESKPSASFNGSGRWALCWNLEAIDRWTLDDVKDDAELRTVYSELLREMHENDLTIEVSYSDEEGGNLVLYRATGTMSSDGETLEYVQSSEENFDYNWKNYMEITGDTGNFDSLIESLCEQVGAKSDRDGAIKGWILANTQPYMSSFDDLDEDDVAKFQKAFRGMQGAAKCLNFTPDKDNCYPLCDNPGCADKLVCCLSAHMSDPQDEL